MTYKKYSIGCLLGLVTLFSACDHYLDVTPKGYTTLSTVTNYDQWLNDGEKLGVSATAELNRLADNVDNLTIKLPASAVLDRAYLWEEQLTTDVKQAPIFWGTHYANINKYNTVLLGIDEATDGTGAMKRSLKAEALLGRAFEYYYLLNLFAKPYDAATAQQDLGVPFVTSNDVAQQVPDRGTLQEVYDRIIDDIQLALPDLPADNSKNRMRGSRYAAHSVLARIYLSMRNYTAAGKEAKQALEMPGLQAVDFRQPIPPDISSLSIRPDAIYARRLMANETPDSAFMASFDERDLRLKVLYSRSGKRRGQAMFMPMVTGAFALMYTNTGTSWQEMKLIVAESAARAGDTQEALKQLNAIREVRFAEADFEPLQSNVPEEVLSWVWREREQELPYSGLRWFDMRRLDQEGLMKDVSRYDATGTLITSLKPQDKRYTLQIPTAVSVFNPDMALNDW